MIHVHVFEVDRGVAVGVGGVQMPVRDLLAALIQRAGVREGGFRTARGIDWRDIAVHGCDVLRCAETLQDVLMRDDAGTRARQPFIAAYVVEVVVRVDEDCDRSRAGRVGLALHRFGGLRESAIDQQQSVAETEHGDISSGAAEQAQLVREGVEFESGLVLRGSAGGQPEGRRCRRDELEQLTASESGHGGHCSGLEARRSWRIASP